MAALRAFENIFARDTRLRHKGRSRITFDPATGAAIVPADIDAIIRKALSRSARRFALRAKIVSYRLSIQIFFVERRRALLLARGDLRRFLVKHSAYRHRRSPSRKPNASAVSYLAAAPAYLAASIPAWAAYWIAGWL
jgi:hypothetical protein